MAQWAMGLQIRGDDVDRTGTVSAARLLSLLEHARWQALQDPEMGLGSLMQGGHKLVVRAQLLELGARAVYADEVQIRLWLRRVGGTSVELGHEISRNGQRVAQAIVTAVHLGPDGRPVRVPEALRQLVQDVPLPETLVRAGPPDQEPPLDAFVFRHTVRPSEADLFGHVNHAQYLNLLDDARLFGEAAHAFGPDWLDGQPLLRVALDYRQEVKARQTVTARVWALDATSLGVELTREGSEGPLTRATLWVQHSHLVPEALIRT